MRHIQLDKFQILKNHPKISKNSIDSTIRNKTWTNSFCTSSQIEIVARYFTYLLISHRRENAIEVQNQSFEIATNKKPTSRTTKKKNPKKRQQIDWVFLIYWICYWIETESENMKLLNIMKNMINTIQWSIPDQFMNSFNTILQKKSKNNKKPNDILLGNIQGATTSEP